MCVFFLNQRYVRHVRYEAVHTISPAQCIKARPVKHLLYEELVPWYRLLDPIEEHEEEAELFAQALKSAIVGPAHSLLEIGAGAGNNAMYLKPHFACTLTDISAPMLDLSRAINPECTHIVGDMRSMRLEQAFDAVLVHDAIVYMTTEQELRQALDTAFIHTRPGGAAIIALDYTTERFEEFSLTYEKKEDDRELRCLEWMWDPDPSDQTYRVDYAFLLREGDQLHAVHDTHIEGLFSHATWVRLLQDVGYQVEMIARPIGDGEYDEIYLCRRPMHSL